MGSGFESSGSLRLNNIGSGSKTLLLFLACNYFYRLFFINDFQILYKWCFKKRSIKHTQAQHNVAGQHGEASVQLEVRREGAGAEQQEVRQGGEGGEAQAQEGHREGEHGGG